MPDDTTQQDKIDKLDKMVRDIKIAMFTTTDEHNKRLYSRPMAAQDGLDNGSLFFFTYEDSNKVDEFKTDRQVNVSFVDNSSSRYASVAGVAKLVGDRSIMEEKWDESLRAWFADGLDTKGIILIRVDATEAQYWDSRNQAMLHVYGAIKAYVTGEPVKDAGENETVTFA